jgi:hypothetical protein
MSLARALESAAEDRAEAEAELKATQATEREIGEKLIPDLMDELGVESFTTTDGKTITLRETIRASVPKANIDQAYSWLATNGHGEIIKRVLSVPLGRDSTERAEMLKATLSDLELPFGEAKKVEPSTLRALIRELLESGAEVPLDLFGAWRQRKAVIK